MSELVLASDLAVGDLLPGGATLISVGRDEASGRVWLADDDGAVKSVPGTARLVVIERGPRPALCGYEPPLSPRERVVARQRLDTAAERR